MIWRMGVGMALGLLVYQVAKRVLKKEEPPEEEAEILRPDFLGGSEDD